MTISGVSVPELIIIDEDMLLKGNKSQPNVSLAHLRFVTTEKEEKNKIYSKSSGYKKAQERLLNFASLFTWRHGVGMAFKGFGLSSLVSKEKLGEGRGIGVKISVNYPPEMLKEYTKQEHERISNFVKYFKNNEEKLNRRQNHYLKNALHYFYYGNNSIRPEEQIINYFISVESLVGEQQELTYRIATRMTALLGSRIQGKNALNILNNMKQLYKLRSNIVHGNRYTVTYSDVNNLQKYLREIIKIFLKLSDEMSRENILSIIEDSIFDDKSRKKLDSMITEKLSPS